MKTRKNLVPILLGLSVLVSCQNKNLKRDKTVYSKTPKSLPQPSQDESSAEEQMVNEEAKTNDKAESNLENNKLNTLKSDEKLSADANLSFVKALTLNSMEDRTKQFVLNKNFKTDPTPSGLCTITHRVRNRDIRVFPKAQIGVDKLETGIFDGGLTTEIQIEFKSNKYGLENMVCAFSGTLPNMKSSPNIALDQLQNIFDNSANKNYFKSYKSGCNILSSIDSQIYYDFCY